jgi:hypothetical protein
VISIRRDAAQPVQEVPEDALEARSPPNGAGPAPGIVESDR